MIRIKLKKTLKLNRLKLEFKYKYYCVLFALSFSFISCDSGDIYEEVTYKNDGIKCEASIIFKNISSWPIDYQVAIAAYKKEEIIPSISKAIGKPSIGDTTRIELAGIPFDSDRICISILNKSRKSVTDLYSYNIQSQEIDAQNTSLGLLSIDLLNYTRIQNQFFSNCINCHGGTSFAAADLDLTEGNSYNAIVNVNSKIVKEKKLVTPGIETESFILDILEHSSENISYNHTNVSFNSQEEDIKLLKLWINSLN